MKRLAALACVAGLLGAAAFSPTAAAEGPVVVELFTSEGCSSCPPADAYLGELAKRPDIVALSYHVDYWDYIGWKDPYALPAATARQRHYTAALGNRFLYTPEMVIDGGHDVTGSDRDAAGKLIGEHEKSQGKLAVAVSEPRDDKYTVRIPASSLPAAATVWMALFDREHDTPVADGENAGRTLKEFNIVRELKALGRYDGKAMEIPLAVALTGKNGCAILVQADAAPGDGQGAILGAAVIKER